MPATSYYPSPAPTGLADAPESMLNKWPGTWMPQNLERGACLAPGQEHLAHSLLVWAERQLSKELDAKKSPGFEAAIISFLLAYRDSPVDLSKASSTVGNKKVPAIIDPKRLVRKTCEMRCWYRIWQTSALYSCSHGGGSTSSSLNEPHTELPVAALWELRKLATNALIACENQILLDLDELSPSMAPLIELSHWACIWEMILIYRQLVAGYSNLAQTQLENSMYGVSTGE